jgi:hypothetical protein
MGCAESGMHSACLSSPHLRTNSVQEPPRSVVLLGKRGIEEEAGEPTPASKLRSVRQKTADGTDLPFLLPQPLFAAGGSSSGRHGPPHDMQGGHDDAGQGSDRRGGRGGKGAKKKMKEAPNRNRRKPSRSSVRQHQVGVDSCCSAVSCGLAACRGFALGAGACRCSMCEDRPCQSC